MTRAWKFDPKLDLKLERVVDVPRELVWRAWTEPEHLMKWFCPRPWMVVECEIDLRPGGLFRTVMQGPDGERHDDSDGCCLEVIPQERLVWTNTMGPGFRPLDPGFLPFTAVITMTPEGNGTRYTATAIHRDPDGKTKHEEMGFHQGWGAAFDQLVEMAKKGF